MAKENMFIAGIWCAARKPPTFSFLEPVMKRLKSLQLEGIIIYTKKFT
jgi:hypothetical protein